MAFRDDAFAGGLEPVAPTGSRRKVHLAMDTATSEIRAVEFTPRGVAYEAPTLDESLTAAKAAAESRHWREHFAGTVLGQEGRDG